MLRHSGPGGVNRILDFLVLPGRCEAPLIGQGRVIPSVLIRVGELSPRHEFRCIGIPGMTSTQEESAQLSLPI